MTSKLMAAKFTKVYGRNAALSEDQDNIKLNSLKSSGGFNDVFQTRMNIKLRKE